MVSGCQSTYFGFNLIFLRARGLTAKRPTDEVTLFATIDLVKQWQKSGNAFTIAYEPEGFTADGKPQYRATYTLTDNGQRDALVSTHLTEHGPDVRLFNLWPGLFKHHHEFGDGRKLVFDDAFGVSLIEE